MYIDVAIDICALVLFIFLIISICYRNKLWSLADKVFLVLIIVCTFTTIADALNVYMSKNGLEYSYGILYGSSQLYFLLRNLTPVLYLCYIITSTGQWSMLTKKPALLLTLILPTTISVVLVLTNSLTHKVFYYDEAHVYHRGPWLLILYCNALYFMLYSLVYAIRHKNLIENEKRYAIISFVPLSMGSVLIQMLYPQILIEMFTTAICLMLIMFTLQKKEDVIDGNTGLWNRVSFIQDINRNLIGERKFTVISIYLCNLSLLTKTIGFLQAETVIAQMAHYLKQYLSDAEGLYMTGEGHFHLILSGKKQLKKKEIAESINEKFKSTWRFQELELNLLVCVAVSECPNDFTDKDVLLQFTATFPQYCSYNGKVQYAHNLKGKMLNKELLEQIIEKALLEKRFQVYYQPIFSSKDGRFCSAEALLRLYDKTYGFISPQDFIPVAEENTSILKIGQFVLETVCEFMASYQLKEKGIDYIEINLSAVQCIQADMADNIIRTLKRYCISPTQINLEVTETAAVNSSKIMLKNMERLQAEGICFSLDDYGSGYANINYLLKFPFSLIKLDKDLVVQESQNEKGAIALRYSIEMLRAMGFQIVAEGVETKELAKLLAAYNCDYQQGYYFSRPMPGSDFIEFLDRNKESSPSDFLT